MSVIIKDSNYRNGGKIYLLTKGADDVILNRSNCSEAEAKCLEEQLYNYASHGLRTLVLGWKQLDLMAYK